MAPSKFGDLGKKVDDLFKDDFGTLVSCLVYLLSLSYFSHKYYPTAFNFVSFVRENFLC